ncbi:MAG: hypothetical protein PHV13_05395 [Candidatus ainarchaeum sp.]|nr:hypothetical protein [Candidatus ainarchaeum sp.]
MAGPMQKTGEEKEAAQVRQFAGLMLDFHKAQYAYAQELNKQGGAGKPASATKKAYDAECRKVEAFALGHVQLLRRMLEISLTGEHVDLDGRHLGLSEGDRKALQVIDGIKGAEYAASARMTLHSGLWPEPTRIMLSAKTKTGVVDLFSFYYGGKEASGKTGNVALYPSDWVYEQVGRSQLGSVPKKVQ